MIRQSRRSFSTTWPRRVVLILAAVWSGLLLVAQEVPELIAFQPADYGASGQNWMITQAADGSIFVANSDGVLRYNGFDWQQIPLDNQARARVVVKGADGRIYAGGYQSFGYLQPRGATFVYQAISQSVIADRKEEVWHAFRSEEGLFFQSFAEVYQYDYQELSLRIPPGNIMFGARVGEQVLFPKVRGGIWTYEQEEFRNLPVQGAFPPDAKITGICALPNEQLLVATQFYGLFIRDTAGQVQPLAGPLQRLAQSNQVNRVLRLSTGQIVIGTIQDGVYLLDESLELRYRVNRSTGLTNNTVLSLYEDATGDLWIGTDHGLNLLRLSNPDRYFYDRNDRIGSIFETITYQDQLFLGSNKGLFFEEAPGRFTSIPALKGQVWGLLDDQRGNLLVGHNEGTFVYRNETVRQISSVTGGLRMVPLPDGRLLQSTFTGWILLRPTPAGWVFAQRVPGTGISFPHYWLSGHTAYGFNSNEGLLRQEFSPDFTEVLSSLGLQGPAISANAEPRFFARGDSVYFCTSADCYQIQDTTYRWVSSAGAVQEIDREARREGDTILPFYGGYLRKKQGLPLDRDSIYIDYLLVNGRYQQAAASLRLSAARNNLDIQLGNQNLTATSPEYEYSISRSSSPTAYWSPLPRAGRIRLQALQAGAYIVTLRRQDGNHHTLLEFEVLPPWYATPLARLLYFFGLVLLVYLLLAFQNRRSQRAQERLLREKEREMERERILAKNNELEREVQYKSQMLANSTMTLIQKNKMLNELKDYAEALGDQKDLDKARARLLRMINRNLNSDEDWQIFEQTFNQIHHAFMERLMQDYADLGPDDLKLAAYIRIGLSSKEIAPLMNIAFRSVENKRSRLRKKLQLDSGDNLKDFLIHY